MVAYIEALGAGTRVVAQNLNSNTNTTSGEDEVDYWDIDVPQIPLDLDGRAHAYLTAALDHAAQVQPSPYEFENVDNLHTFFQQAEPTCELLPVAQDDAA